MSDVASLTISSIRQGLQQKKFSATELAEAALHHAAAKNAETNAFLTLAPELALATARKVDEEIASGAEVGPLAGVPVAVKDVIVTKGLRTTCGSRILESYVPPYNATAVLRLEAAGAVVQGEEIQRADRALHGAAPS